MSRLSLFNSPLMLGFDHFERTLERIDKSGDGYPPYNIERVGENDLRITLAVAGFAAEDDGLLSRQDHHYRPNRPTIQLAQQHRFLASYRAAGSSTGVSGTCTSSGDDSGAGQ